MKKFNIWCSLLLSVLLFAACEADRDSNPVINTGGSTASFTLFNPVQSAQFIDLENNSIYLTWSQPDYGYNAITTYKVHVGLVQADGTIKWNTKDVKDDNGNVIGTEDEFVISTYNTCKAEISGKNIAMEINEIDGLDDIANYADKGYRKIALRVHASINITSTQEIEGTGVFSNAVVFNEMRSYAIIKAPATLYLVGTPNGWLAPEAKNEETFIKDEDGKCWILTETEIGNNIFEGTLEFEAGNLQFRFYTSLDGWGDDNDPKGSIGPQEKDEGIEVGFDADGLFPNTEFSDGGIMKGKGSWIFKGFTGGKIKMTVDMNAMTVKFAVVEDE